MIVADANLIAHLSWRSELTAIAEAVWARDAQWTAPALWPSELRSALGTAIRRRALTLDAALAVIEHAESAVQPAPFDASSRSVLELSRDTGCSTHDCEYVALAIALGVPLVTSDRAVLRAFPKVAISPADFTASGP